MARHLIIVENEGRPDIANSVEHLEICTMNEKENKFKRYKIVFDDNGVAQLECFGDYEQDDQSEFGDYYEEHEDYEEFIRHP